MLAKDLRPDGGQQTVQSEGVCPILKQCKSSGGQGVTARFLLGQFFGADVRTNVASYEFQKTLIRVEIDPTKTGYQCRDFIVLGQELREIAGGFDDLVEPVEEFFIVEHDRWGAQNGLHFHGESALVVEVLVIQEIADFVP